MTVGPLRHLVHNAILDVRRLLNLFSQLDRDAVGGHYLKGTGIEIGALHNPFKAPKGATVRYVDREPLAALRKHYPELAGYDVVDPDIIDDGEKLATVGDATQDFVIANHFLEHCENPVGAVLNMVRVLKKNGILFMCVPDKRYTFDNERPVTAFEHVVKDFTEGPAWSHRGHFEEWVELVEHISDPQAAEVRTRQLIESNYSIHFHVWSEPGILEFLIGLKERFDAPLDLELFLKNNGEFVLILSKTR